MRKIISFTLCMIAIGLSSCAAPSKKASGPETAMTPPTAEQMQQAFAKMSTTTAEHTMLNKLAGTWRAEAKWWMDPAGKPEVTKGRSVNTMVLGGKFLRQEYSGKFMGKKFEGVGYTGYDTVMNEFNSIWMDSMSTATMVSSGAPNANEQALNLQGSMSCPLMNGKMDVRSSLRMIDDKHHVFEMYNRTPDGNEFKTLEINYTKLNS